MATLPFWVRKSIVPASSGIIHFEEKTVKKLDFVLAFEKVIRAVNGGDELELEIYRGKSVKSYFIDCDAYNVRNLLPTFIEFCTVMDLNPTLNLLNEIEELILMDLADCPECGDEMESEIDNDDLYGDPTYDREVGKHCNACFEREREQVRQIRQNSK